MSLDVQVKLQGTAGVDERNSFPFAYHQQVKGCPQLVDTLADRDALPEHILELGMPCYVRSENKTFRYQDSGWVEVESDGSSYLEVITTENPFTVIHGLNKYPEVTAIDSQGNEVVIEVTHLNKTQVKCSWLGSLNLTLILR